MATTLMPSAETSYCYWVFAPAVDNRKLRIIEERDMQAALNDSMVDYRARLPSPMFLCSSQLCYSCYKEVNTYTHGAEFRY